MPLLPQPGANGRAAATQAQARLRVAQCGGNLLALALVIGQGAAFLRQPVRVVKQLLRQAGVVPRQFGHIGTAAGRGQLRQLFLLAGLLLQALLAGLHNALAEPFNTLGAQGLLLLQGLQLHLQLALAQLGRILLGLVHGQLQLRPPALGLALHAARGKQGIRLIGLGLRLARAGISTPAQGVDLCQHLAGARNQVGQLAGRGINMRFQCGAGAALFGQQVLQRIGADIGRQAPCPLGKLVLLLCKCQWLGHVGQSPLRLFAQSSQFFGQWLGFFFQRLGCVQLHLCGLALRFAQPGASQRAAGCLNGLRLRRRHIPHGMRHAARKQQHTPKDPTNDSPPCPHTPHTHLATQLHFCKKQQAAQHTERNTAPAVPWRHATFLPPEMP